MKRDLKIVRMILLNIEEDKNARVKYETIANSHVEVVQAVFSEAQINEHLLLLKEAELIDTAVRYYEDGRPNFTPIRLTWQGHEFLETIRDQKQFEKIIDKLSPFQNFTIPLIRDISISLVKSAIGVNV